MSSTPVYVVVSLHGFIRRCLVSLKLYRTLFQDVRIYDLVSQTSLQSFYHMALIRGLGHNPPSAAYVNNVSLTLVVAVDSAIAIMDSKDDDISVMPFATHNCRVNAVLYNPLFKQVPIQRTIYALLIPGIFRSINQSISQASRYLFAVRRNCTANK